MVASRYKINSILWTLASSVLAIIIAAPIMAIIAKAMQDFDITLWKHLANTVLPTYLWNSFVLVIGVCSLASLFGIGCAWLVVRYQFFARGILEWLLLLPAAVPAYIVAYCYTDFFEYGGFVQNLLRDLFGWESAEDYVFFEIRSLGGAIVVMGSVLYPYIYLLSRLAFRSVSSSLYEVASIHNRSLFFSVALPIGRPAIIGGLALVAMESLADFGTVEFFAVETLTLGIFNLWLGMNNLSAASQLSFFAFFIIFILLAIEHFYRGERRFAVKSRIPVGNPFGDVADRHFGSMRVRLFGWRSFGLFLLCSIPFVLGFILPIGILLGFILEDFSLPDVSLFLLIGNSLWVAGLASFVIVIIALLLALVSIYRHNIFVSIFAFVATKGYAFSGIILAVGVLLLVGYLGDYLWFFSGSILLLLFAYVVRFNAVGFAAIYDGVLKLPPDWLSASLVLGRGFFISLFRLGLPLLRRSIFVGGLLCFVDVMKELPMVLLLRPFNFDTLATVTYEYAHSELLGIAAIPSLLIILVGLLPVVVVNILLERR